MGQGLPVDMYAEHEVGANHGRINGPRETALFPLANNRSKGSPLTPR